MLRPAARREAVAHLKTVMGLSERRACQIISADRKMVRYRSRRPPEVELRARRESSPTSDGASAIGGCSSSQAGEEPSGVNRVYRLYRKEALSVRKRKPDGVPSARVRRSSSRLKPMPAGRWISYTTSSPAEGGSVCSNRR